MKKRNGCGLFVDGHTDRQYEKAYCICMVVLMMLLILSWVTFKERIIFVDSCWNVFNVINDRNLGVPEHRYGAFITKLPVLVGLWLGLSLRSLLIIYSTGFYLFYMGVAFLMGNVLKQKWLVVLLTLYLTLFISDGFFWPVNEVHAGITWMCLFFALYLNRIERGPFYWYHYLLLCLLAFLSISSHMLVMVPFAFLWIMVCYHNLNSRRAKQPVIIIFSALLITLAIWRYLYSLTGWYDPVKLSSLNDMSLQKLWMALYSGCVHTFFWLSLKNYWGAVILFLFGVSGLLREKKYLILGGTVIFLIGYIVLISLVFPNWYGRNLQFYMESEWAPLAVLMVVPFLIWGVRPIKGRSVVVLLSFIFLTRFIYIGNAYRFFSARFEKLQTLTSNLERKGISKAVIIEQNSVMDSLLIMHWGLPVETLVLSEMEHFRHPVTAMAADTSFQIVQPRYAFFSCFGTKKYTSVNFKYFQPDSISTYTIFDGVGNLLHE